MYAVWLSQHTRGGREDIFNATILSFHLYEGHQACGASPFNIKPSSLLHLLLLLLPPIFTLYYTRDNFAIPAVTAIVSISRVLFGFELLLYSECYSECCWELRVGLVTKKSLNETETDIQS